MIGYAISVLAGYYAYTWGSATKTGENNKLDEFLSKKLGREIKTSLKHSFDVGTSHEVYIHLHHWCYLLGASMLVPSDYFTYFAIGGIIQGVGGYNDWWDVITIKEKQKVKNN